MISKNEAKYIQSLNHKKKRREEGVFVVEGPKQVDELLRSELEVQKLYALQEWADQNKLPGFELTIVTNEELERISTQKTPNKVVAIVKQPVVNNTIEWNKELFIALDEIQDPGNLGTIIRIADWFGIKHIVASEDTADVYNPKVIQATMGSFTRVSVHYVSLKDFFEQHHLDVYAAVLNGTPVHELSKLSHGCLLIGNEGNGISSELDSFLTHKVTIPGRGEAESLNAAVATGIILSHMILR